MSKSAWERVVELLRQGREKSVGVFHLLPETDSIFNSVYGEAVKKPLVDLARREEKLGRVVLRGKK